MPYGVQPVGSAGCGLGSAGAADGLAPGLEALGDRDHWGGPEAVSVAGQEGAEVAQVGLGHREVAFVESAMQNYLDS